MGRLKPKPFQPVRPELGGVARQQDASAGPSDADALADYGLRIDVKGGESVLDADDHVERPVAKAQREGVHLRKLAIRHAAQELRTQLQAGRGRVDADDLPGGFPIAMASQKGDSKVVVVGDLPPQQLRLIAESVR